MNWGGCGGWSVSQDEHEATDSQTKGCLWRFVVPFNTWTREPLFEHDMNFTGWNSDIP
jgi:hypothetical protein